MADEKDPTSPFGLGAKGGTGDDAADDDRDGGGDTGPRGPYELLTGDGEPPQADDGESVGASDREADIRRSR